MSVSIKVCVCVLSSKTFHALAIDLQLHRSEMCIFSPLC